MRIDISDLESVFLFALKLIKVRHQEKILLEQNFYWTVWMDDLYALDSKPEELGLGSLVDEWEFIKSSMSQDDVNPYTLVWVGELVKAIGAALNQETIAE